MTENPYQVLGATVPSMLGRAALVERIEGHLLKPSPDHVSVVGPAHYGKSVLLRHLADAHREGSSKYLTTVHIDLRRDTPATDGAFNGLLVEMELEADEGVSIHRETTAESITGNRVLIQTRGVTRRLEVGAVVIGSRTPNSELSDELARAGLRADIHTIGDAVRPRDLYAAGQEAADMAERINLTARAGALRPTPATPTASA